MTDATNAWMEHTIPPRAKRDACRDVFARWPCEDHPADVMLHYTSRVRNLATLLKTMLEQWNESTFEQHNDAPSPHMTLYRDQVQGVVELMDVIGESIDLAENATEQALQREKVAK